MSLPAVSDAPPPPRAHAQGAATDAVHAALDFFGVPDAAYKYEARQPEPPRARAPSCARRSTRPARGCCCLRAVARAVSALLLLPFRFRLSCSQFHFSAFLIAMMADSTPITWCGLGPSSGVNSSNLVAPAGALCAHPGSGHAAAAAGQPARPYRRARPALQLPRRASPRIPVPRRARINPEAGPTKQATRSAAASRRSSARSSAPRYLRPVQIGRASLSPSPSRRLPCIPRKKPRTRAGRCCGTKRAASDPQGAPAPAAAGDCLPATGDLPLALQAPVPAGPRRAPAAAAARARLLPAAARPPQSLWSTFLAPDSGVTGASDRTRLVHLVRGKGRGVSV